MDESTFDWQFIIPLSKEDLLKGSSGQYTVNNVIELKTCLNTLRVITKDIANKGCSCILQHFDILYSLLSDKDINFIQLQEVYDGVISRLLKDVSNFVRATLRVDDPDSKPQAVNIIKMNFYIFSLFEKCYEDKLSFNSDNFISEPKRFKGTKPRTKSIKPEDQWDWNMKKKSAFANVNEVLQEKISTFWPSYVVEEAFVNLIGNCCYKAFENPDIGQAKLKPLRDTVSQVLASLVASYNHGLTFIPKIVQLMKQHEHAASAISSAAILMSLDYNCSTVIPKLLKELQSAIQEEDIPGLAKSSATFVTDIAETHPVLLLPCIKSLTGNLALEPYVLRNASLIAFTEIILKCYLDKNLIEEDKGKRDILLKYLLNHLRDQNSYVRSKVLQLWCKLASNHAVPKSFLTKLIQTAKNRISDKSSMAVKNAVTLFTVILKENPYAGRLNLADMRGELLQAKTLLNKLNSKRTLPIEEAWAHMEVNIILELNKHFSNLENLPEKEEVSPTPSVNITDVLLIIFKLLQEKHFIEAISLLKQCESQFPNAQEIRCNMDKSLNPVEYYRAVLKKIFTKIPDICDKAPLEFDSHHEEYITQKAVVSYIEETINFTLLMNDIGKDINTILKSKSVMGVSEAIEFFTVAFQFGVADSKKVMRNILLLVRCDQPVIKDAVAGAFKKLYLTTCQKTAKAKALQVAQRLIKLLKDLDLEQKGALEDLVELWILNHDINKDFIQVLWEKFVKKHENTSDEESLMALMLLDMMANKKPSLVSSNMETIISTGLTPRSDLMTVEYSCKMLTKLSLIKKGDNTFMRLPNNDELFVTTSDLIVNYFDNLNTKGYKAMSLAAIKMISKISYCPEKVLDQLLKRLCQKVFNADENVGETSGDADLFGSDDSPSMLSIKEGLLERLLLIHGEIMFRKWQYLNNDVVNTLSKSNKPLDPATNENNEIDEFEEAEYRDAEDDALMNSVNELCEELILQDSTIDAHIRDLAVKVCKNFREQYSTTLKATAAMSLAKYMMVSQSYCEDKIQLFVTLMGKSSEEVVRGNAVLAFGDFLIRFPNVIEPWSPHLFSRLSDASVLVRKNTVVVINHLVTREMIKVRGHVVEVCLCLEDNEPSIAEQVHSLFIDLAKKGNALYNIIPDIISRLSTPERSESITSDIFDKIMRFVLGLIGKERQNELLVEKLCSRICESNNERQWRDLAFCLTLLHYNEKSLRKLIEALPLFNERLMCPDVHNCVLNIFNNAQKSTKQNFKDIANEGIIRIKEILTGKEGGSDKEIISSPPKEIVTPTKFATPSIPSKLRSARKTRKPRI